VKFINSDNSKGISMPGPVKKAAINSSREKFLSLSLESTRKSYYPQLQKNLETTKENERRLQLLIDNLPAMISYIDTEERYVSANLAYEKAFGMERSRIIGQHVMNILGEGNYRKVEHHIKKALSGKHVRFETEFSNPRDEKRILEVQYVPDINHHNKVSGFYVLTIDITEKKQSEEEKRKLEKRLQQAQKMESLGTLAGGIAHDFNNILAPLLGFAELLKAELPPDSPLQEYVDGILGGAFRSRDMVKQILAFSRQAEKEVIPMKLQPVIKEVIHLLRSSIPSTIRIDYDISRDCGIVMADPTQIHQIIMNLATNAYHAMEQTGGRLAISLEQILLESDPNRFQELAPGEYALLRITDTGCGIGQEIIDRIFDPYFTTKEKDKGTGLGLSVVQGIVKTFQGEIHLASEPGAGTVASVYLPIARQKLEQEEMESFTPVPGGSESLLLVDDEENVVRMVRLVLEKLGYRITACTGSIEALKVFSENPAGFDLVITDMTMPAMTGAQLSRELKSIRPGIPVILCSGFSDQLTDEKLRALGVQGFLLKPLLRHKLATTIRKALG
jgi:PAS domain S-box-containing protein